MSLLDFVNSAITPELTSSLAARFGIPADAAASGLKTSAATMLTTLASKANDHNFIAGIYSLIAGSGTMAAASAAGSSVSAAAGATLSTASNFITQLFGTHLPDVEASVAHATGIPATAAAGVMVAAAPLVLGSLAQRVHAGGLTAATMGSTLTAELPRLRGYLPAGFAIPGLAAFSSAASTAPANLAAKSEEKGVSGWLWPVLIAGALLIGFLIWYFNRSDSTAKVAETTSQTTTAVADSAAKATAAVSDATKGALATLGSFFKRKLPNGVELNIPENGIENKLVAFIEDASKPVDKTTWFDFDRLLFATGSATLEPSSTEQLTNVAAIMKAYPKVDIRIGGYTDNTGDAAANMKLSQDRAANVMAELVNLGVDPSRMDSKGYGDQHPVADNATEEGRAKNRRISLRVTQK